MSAATLHNRVRAFAGWPGAPDPALVRHPALETRAVAQQDLSVAVREGVLDLLGGFPDDWCFGSTWRACPRGAHASPINSPPLAPASHRNPLAPRSRRCR